MQYGLNLLSAITVQSSVILCYSPDGISLNYLMYKIHLRQDKDALQDEQRVEGNGVPWGESVLSNGRTKTILEKFSI